MKPPAELKLELEKKEGTSETNYQAITHSLNKPTTTITLLPIDVLLFILSYLNAHELTQIASVCKFFSILAANDQLWKKLFTEIREADTIIESSSLSYKQLYANEKTATALKLQEELKRFNIDSKLDLILEIPKGNVAENFKKFLKELAKKPKQKSKKLFKNLLNACTKNHKELVKFLENNKNQLSEAFEVLDISMLIRSFIYASLNPDLQVFPTLAWFLSENDLIGDFIANLFQYNALKKYAYIFGKLAATLHDKLVVYFAGWEHPMPLIHYVIINYNLHTPWLLRLLVAYDIHCLTYKFNHEGKTKTALAFALEFSYPTAYFDAFAILCEPFYPVLKFHSSNTLYPIIPTVFWKFPGKALSFLTHMKKSDVIRYRDSEDGNTILHLYFEICCCFRIVDDHSLILKHYKKLINVVNKNEETLIHIIINKNKEYMNSDYSFANIIKILLEYGIDINVRNKQGLSALDAARQYHLFDIIELLEEKTTQKTEVKNSYTLGQ